MHRLLSCDLRFYHHFIWIYDLFLLSAINSPPLILKLHPLQFLCSNMPLWMSVENAFSTRHPSLPSASRTNWKSFYYAFVKLWLLRTHAIHPITLQKDWRKHRQVFIRESRETGRGSFSVSVLCI
ncbi:UNVERIFIED_CONTAM: hypothetical protein K2H54_054288 [Gekko kuhli]